MLKFFWPALLFGFTFLLSPIAAAAPIERTAYVTSELDNTMSIIDLTTEKIIKVLPTGKTPHALAITPAGKGYINNRNSDFLTVFNANSYQNEGQVSLPGLSFQISLSPDGSILAVTYRNLLAVTLIDTATDSIIRTVSIGEDKSGFKGARMRHPYWSADGQFVYVQDNVNNTIVKVQAASGNIAATIAMTGSNHYLQPDKTGKFLYACGESLATGSGAFISVIDTETASIYKTISIPLAAGETALGHHGEFSPDKKYFFYANSGGNTITVINTNSLEIEGTIHGNAGPGHLYTTKNGKRFFVLNHTDHVVSVIDIAQQKIIKEVAVGTGANQAHNGFFTSDGQYFYMINAEDGNLHKISVANLSSVSTVHIGTLPMFFAIKENNHFIVEE